jgi:hypothetical protein
VPTGRPGVGRSRTTSAAATTTPVPWCATPCGSRKSYLDAAVLEGIRKRLDRVLDREGLRRRLSELLQSSPPPSEIAATVKAQLAQVRQKIGRLVEALADGTEDLPSVRAALAVLETRASSSGGSGG